MLHGSEAVGLWLHHLYWRAAWVGGAALALPQLWTGSETLRGAAGVYLAATLVAWLLARRYPQWITPAHLGLALGLLVWVFRQTGGGATLGWHPEISLYASAALATLGLTVLGLFGGLWLMLGGLILLVMLLPHPDSGPYWAVWAVWALGGLVGLSMFKALHRLEVTQQELSKAALRDRQTGLSTRLALEADYERYQALASRTDQPLLFSYWLWGTQDSKDPQNLRQEMAQLMQEALRQGDGLYRLDHDQFCGLHIGMVSGHQLTEHLSQRFGKAQVVWVVCNGLTLEEALNQAQDLLYRGPRQPARGMSAVPRA
ncbi:diguanylate cyclase [Meiothermus sp.]|uniref:diguanylate cyclase n=1 Tax=Meiothermus sp. TaxID=1955249 RepID=UPI0021DBE1DB|nr:diguanylate cyclase [Meiothermus sp.]GIW25393.1 MAG: hypothetical protein KatS3mg069_1660 [Meiothermus sp.]